VSCAAIIAGSAGYMVLAVVLQLVPALRRSGFRKRRTVKVAAYS
jgi:hypothetical protein